MTSFRFVESKQSCAEEGGHVEMCIVFAPTFPAANRSLILFSHKREENVEVDYDTIGNCSLFQEQSLFQVLEIHVLWSGLAPCCERRAENFSRFVKLFDRVASGNVHWSAFNRTLYYCFQFPAVSCLMLPISWYGGSSCATWYATWQRRKRSLSSLTRSHPTNINSNININISTSLNHTSIHHTHKGKYWEIHNPPQSIVKKNGKSTVYEALRRIHLVTNDCW